MKLPSFTIAFAPILISVISLFVILSISPEEFQSQLIFFIAGLIIYFLLSQIDYHLLLAFSPFLYIFINILLFITLIIGVTSRGSTRWIDFGFVKLQASEFLKPILILFFSYLSTVLNSKKFTNFLTYLFILGLPCLLIFLEPDLGTTLIVFTIGFYTILNLKPRFKFIFLLLIIASLFIPISYNLLKPYQKSRIQTFLNPSKDPLGSSYNQIQAEIAVGSGQFFGKGLGLGTQSHLQFLPEKHTDFFFAAFSEEFGFLGSFTLISLYFFLSLHLIKLSTRSNQIYHKIIFLSSFAIFFLQASLHIGINIGVFPVTGITLPLMSVGGSSIISYWIILGLCSSASTQIKHSHAIYLE